MLESMSTEASAVKVTVIQPLQNQASLSGLHGEASLVNARHASPAAASVTALQIYGRKFLAKQFVVTNCIKERPGSIVTETLKNGILIPIVT